MSWGKKKESMHVFWKKSSSKARCSQTCIGELLLIRSTIITNPWKVVFTQYLMHSWSVVLQRVHDMLCCRNVADCSLIFAACIFIDCSVRRSLYCVSLWSILSTFRLRAHATSFVQGYISTTTYTPDSLQSHIEEPVIIHGKKIGSIWLFASRERRASKLTRWSWFSGDLCKIDFFANSALVDRPLHESRCALALRWIRRCACEWQKKKAHTCRQQVWYRRSWRACERRHFEISMEIRK